MYVNARMQVYISWGLKMRNGCPISQIKFPAYFLVFLCPASHYLGSLQRRPTMEDPNSSRTLVAAPLNRPRRMTASAHFNSNHHHHQLHHQNQNQPHHIPRRSYLVQRQYALRSYANTQGFTSTSLCNSQAINVSAFLYFMPVVAPPWC